VYKELLRGVAESRAKGDAFKEGRGRCKKGDAWEKKPAGIDFLKKKGGDRHQRSSYKRSIRGHGQFEGKEKNRGEGGIKKKGQKESSYSSPHVKRGGRGGTIIREDHVVGEVFSCRKKSELAPLKEGGGL